MSSTIEQIKDKLSIVDVVGSYIHLEKAGGNYKARCPFHNEKTPSFFISPGRGSFYCFGCGEKGDIFSFVEKFEGLDFMGALKSLATRAGVELRPENPQARTERERLFLCLEAATIFFQKNLYMKEEHKDAVAYLIGRGLTKETIKEWRLGFAENEWRTLLEYLIAKKFSGSDLERVGLIKKKDSNEGVAVGDYYDRFRGRIMFPIVDPSSRVIGFSGRVFGGDESIAKYLNSPDTELFNKSKVLYGFHKAKLAIREKNAAILVEGQMDLLISHQAGATNTVALSGTALTPDHVEMISRLTDNLIMVFDPDSAGIKAAERSARLALSRGMQVKVASLGSSKDAVKEDPAVFIIKHGKDAWDKTLSQAQHIVEFMLDAVLADVASQKSAPSAALPKALRERVLPFVASIEGSMEQSRFISLLYHRTGLSEESIRQELRSVRPAVEEALRKDAELTIKESVAPKGPSRYTTIERKLFGILIWQESLTNAHKEAPRGVNAELIEKRLATILDSETITAKKKEWGAHKDELLLEAEISFDQSEHAAEEIDELLTNFEEDMLKARLSQAIEKLHKAERDKDKSETSKLLAECKELTDRIGSLSKQK
jgi:DNA primase